MRRRDALLVVLSFVPLLVKAVDYATLGSYVPLLVFGFFSLLVWLGARTGPRTSRGFWPSRA